MPIQGTVSADRDIGWRARSSDAVRAAWKYILAYMVSRMLAVPAAPYDDRNDRAEPTGGAEDPMAPAWRGQPPLSTMNAMTRPIAASARSPMHPARRFWTPTTAIALVAVGLPAVQAHATDNGPDGLWGAPRRHDRPRGVRVPSARSQGARRERQHVGLAVGRPVVHELPRHHRDPPHDLLAAGAAPGPGARDLLCRHPPPVPPTAHVPRDRAPRMCTPGTRARGSGDAANLLPGPAHALMPVGNAPLRPIP
jgi:hypothetical protein